MIFIQNALKNHNLSEIGQVLSYLFPKLSFVTTLLKFCWTLLPLVLSWDWLWSWFYLFASFLKFDFIFLEDSCLFLAVLWFTISLPTEYSSSLYIYLIPAFKSSSSEGTSLSTWDCTNIFLRHESLITYLSASIYYCFFWVMSVCFGGWVTMVWNWWGVVLVVEGL